MYKIYYKSSCLYISDCAVVDCITADINEFVTKDSAKMLKFIENNKSVCLITSEPEIIFHQIADKFECVSAAGGVVEYDDNILMIKRNGLWDLPKGHLEANEQIAHCAVRNFIHCFLNCICRKKESSFSAVNLNVISNVFNLIIHIYYLLLSVYYNRFCTIIGTVCLFS